MKSQSLILWVPDVWLRKLAESGCGQNEMYSGRGQLTLGDMGQTKFLLDMVAATKEVAATQHHVPATSTVPAAAPARDLQGIHKAFIYNTRHSQDIPTVKGIHKAFI